MMQSRLTKPPGPKGHRLLGSLMEIRRDRIRFVTEATRSYGDVVSFTMGPRRIYLLRHPDHIRHVLMENHENYVKGLGLKHATELLGSGLLTSEGAQWSRQRQEITPSLSHEINQQRFAQRVASIVERRINRWRNSSSIDVAREMVLLGITIVGDTMLGYSLEDHAEQIADDLNVVTTDAMKRMTAALPGPWNRIGRNAKSALKHLDELVFDPVRKFGNREQACFPEVLDHTQENEQELRDQVMTLLVAGHETTASTLSWALHLVALHPEIQERVHGEIEHVLEDRLPLPADLPKLPYIGMVLHETMRLYPAVWLLPRRSLNRDMIGGYEIPANSDVLLSVYSMHRHPEFWTAPDEFVPERFAPGASYRAYLPFGAGPRMCAGRRLGMLESVLTLTAAVRAFRFEPLDRKPVETCASLTLHPASGLNLRITSRQRNSRHHAIQQEGKPGEEHKA